MRTRARVLGEQLNPLLTVLPLGMLGSAVLFDFGGLIGRFGFFAHVALWDMAAGLIASLVTVVILLVDLIPAPTGSDARRVLGTETAAVGSMAILFLIVWAERSGGDRAGNAGLFVVEVFALAVGLAGAVLARSFVVGQDVIGRDGADSWASGSMTGSWLIGPTYDGATTIGSSAMGAATTGTLARVPRPRRAEMTVH
jgi:uncharacterized membrane protein